MGRHIFWRIAVAALAEGDFLAGVEVAAATPPRILSNPPMGDFPASLEVPSAQMVLLPGRKCLQHKWCYRRGGTG